MQKRLLLGLAMLFVIPGFLFIAGCPPKPPVVVDPVICPIVAEKLAAKQEEIARLEELERLRIIEEARLKEEAIKHEIMIARKLFQSEHIHFEFDRYFLLPCAKEVLKNKAEWLRANPAVSAIIEGHTDERGTNEYNIALGDRRANSAKTFLVDLGISADRLTTVSYGEERPLDPRSKEQAWATNRRAQFVIVE